MYVIYLSRALSITISILFPILSFTLAPPKITVNGLLGLLIAGPYLSGNQGFVHIEVFNYIIEMSAFTFIISALLLFLLLFIVVYLILKLLHIKTAVFYSNRNFFASKSLVIA